MSHVFLVVFPREQRWESWWRWPSPSFSNASGTFPMTSPPVPEDDQAMNVIGSVVIGHGATGRSVKHTSDTWNKQQSNVSVIRHFSTTEKYTNGKSFICSEIMILRVQLTAKQHNTWLWNSDLSRSGFGSADSHWDAYHAEQKTIPHSTPPPPHTHLKDISTSAPPPYSCCILFGISELIMTSARHGKLDLSWYAKANAKQTSHRHTWARLSPIISL